MLSEDVWCIETEDRGLPVVVQRLQVGMAREMGGRVEYQKLRRGHSPFLSGRRARPG